MLTTVRDVLGAAQQQGYGVGAFGLVNLEAGGGVLEAAQACRSPVILLVGEETGSILPYSLWIDGLKQMADRASVPVAIALDHGTSVPSCLQAVASGLTGVMYDGSGLPFAENLTYSGEVVRAAHAVGVSVEAELGRVPDSSPDGHRSLQEWLTHPIEAADFCARTGVDVLAVAIGTVHGLPLETPCIDFNRLAEIRKRLSVPLALHGVSGTRPDDLRRCVELGIQKFNIYSDLVAEAARQLHLSLERREDIANWQRAIWKGFRDVSASYMELLGSANRAPLPEP